MKILELVVIIGLVSSVGIFYEDTFAQEISSLDEKDIPYKNMQSSLNDIYQDYLQSPESAQYPNDTQMVQIVIELKNKDIPLPDNLGIIVEVIYENLVQAMVPISSLDDIANNENVDIVRKPYYATYYDTPTQNFHGTGTTSEGTHVIKSDLMNREGYTGDGITVAVFDDGFDIYNREISKNIIDYNIMPTEDDEHGTGVSEIIVDVAPDINLYLDNKNNSIVEFLNAVDEIIERGDIDILNMSGGWTGVPSQTAKRISEKVNSAMDSGILWVNAAGNEADAHWGGKFHNPDGNIWHNFSGGDEGIDIDMYFGETIEASLVWDNEFVNFDFCMYENGRKLICSDDYQPLHEPYEYIEYTFDRDTTIDLRIRTSENPTNVNLELFTNFPLNEYATPSSSIIIPADARGSFSVGATHYRTDILEDYSSHGPTKDGRIKPNIVSPTVVTTTAYGLEAFDGTSAAAPHVAGASALLMEKYPEANVTQIRELLEATTYDRREKSNDYGTGRLALDMFVDSDILALYNHENGCMNRSTSCFYPSTLEVSIGDTITWINADTESIRITSGGIDSGFLSRGDRYSETFFQEGTFTYTDSNHPWATGTITVDDPYGIDSFDITGPNQVTMILENPIDVSIFDFGYLEITGESTTRSVIDITKDGTSYILTFDGEPVNTDATALFYDVFIPGRTILANDGQSPILHNISIKSNEIENVIGDDITLEFESSERIRDVIVTINDDVVPVSNQENKWTASKSITKKGLVTFSITAEDVSKNKISITEESSISFDIDNLISGTVFHDINNNGIQDVGEEGIQTRISVLNVTDTNTDSLGSYSFENLPSGTQTIHVDVPIGYDSLSFYETILPNGRDTITFPLISTTGTISVMVTSNDIPVQSATVTLGTETKITDYTGMVSFENISLGNHDITITHDNYQTLSRGLTIEQDTSLEIEIISINETGSAVLSGTITDETGIGISGVISVGDSQTTTDSNGNYTITLNPGTHIITTTSPAFIPESRTVTLYHGENVEDFSLVIKPSITGRVIDTEGNGVAGAFVNVLGVEPITTITDSNGEYSFKDIEPGNQIVYIHVLGDGTFKLEGTPILYEILVMKDKTSLVDDFVIKYTNAGTVNVILEDIPNAMASISTTPKQTGTVFRNVSPGQYTVTVSADGYQDYIEDISVASRQQVDITPVFIPGVNPGDITGTLYGDDFLLNDATVTISTEPPTSTKSKAGLYNFTNIPVGTYTVTFTHPNYDTGYTFVTVNPKETSTISSFTLSSKDTSGVVSGRITDIVTGSPISDAIVSIGSVSTTTTSDGLYSFNDINLGYHTITITANGYQDYTENILVGKTVNITLVPELTGSISGVVIDSSSSFLTGVTVTLSTTPSMTTTSAVGLYNFIDVPVGTYSMSFTHPNYNDSHTFATVSVNETVTILQTLTPKSPVGVVSGIITDRNGNVIPGTVVTLLTTSERVTLTNDLGAYMFANVPVGSFTISVETVGFQPVSETGSIYQNQITVVDVTLEENNFLSIRGLVYEDIDGDDVRDHNEDVFQNIEVALILPSGETITRLTNSIGMFSFDNLKENGIYTVFVETPVFEYDIIELEDKSVTVDLGL